jgi:hypothetical protein
MIKLLRLPLFTLLLLSGCTLYNPPVEHESMKGSGETKVYNESYENVWLAAQKVVEELGLEITHREERGEANGTEKKSGHIEASGLSRMDRAELFVETGTNGDRTQLEVASRTYPFFGNLQNQIQQNVDRHLKEKAWQTSWIHDTPFYLKLNIMLPGRGETVPLYMTYEDGSAISLEPDNGGAVSLDLGYRINRTLSTELAYGNNSYGSTNCFPSCDTSDPGYREGYFSSDFITVTLLYHFYRTAMSEAHINGGFEYYFSSELTRSSPTEDTVVTYHDTTGYHIGVGGSVGRDWFIFADLNYTLGLTYEYSRMEENGAPSTAVYPEWKEINADGLYLSFGLGYHF